MFVGDTKRGIALQKKGRELLKAKDSILSKTLPKSRENGNTEDPECLVSNTRSRSQNRLSLILVV